MCLSGRICKHQNWKDSHPVYHQQWKKKRNERRRDFVVQVSSCPSWSPPSLFSLKIHRMRSCRWRWEICCPQLSSSAGFMTWNSQDGFSSIDQSSPQNRNKEESACSTIVMSSTALESTLWRASVEMMVPRGRRSRTPAVKRGRVVGARVTCWEDTLGALWGVQGSGQMVRWDWLLSQPGGG